MARDSDFLQQLRETFAVEAAEHLRTLGESLLSIERGAASGPQGGEAETALEAAFRAAHSLKGAARAVEMGSIETLCQSLEDVLAAWRRGTAASGALPASGMDLLHRTLDGIAALMQVPAEGQAPGAHGLKPAELAALRRGMRELAGSLGAGGARRPPMSMPTASFVTAPAVARAPVVFAAPSPAAVPPAVTARAIPPVAADPVAPMPLAPSVSPAIPQALREADTPPATARGTGARRPAFEGTVRVALPKLEAQLIDTEELLVAKLSSAQRVEDARELGEWARNLRRAWSAVELDVARLGRLDTSPATGRVLDFLRLVDNSTRRLETRAAEASRSARHDRDVVSRSLDGVLDHARRLLMLPFSSISVGFARTVRELARSLGKDIDFRIDGEQVELEKRVLEEIKDPLLHMLRNAVDHGIESPADRAAAGKPATARLTLTVSQPEPGRVSFALADDGAGIPVATVRETAVARGLLTGAEADAMDNEATLALVFRSGFSTRETVSDLSGRGLGLAIVREHVERLGGRVSVNSEAGVGTTFLLSVPAMRAATRGILCECGGRQFMVPTATVERVARVPAREVRTVEGRETVSVAGRVLPLVHLADVLSLAPTATGEARPEQLQLLVAGPREESVAWAVDAVLGEQELLVKPLARPLVRVRNVEGVAVLGSGAIVPVLHVADLIRSARALGPMAYSPSQATASAPDSVRPTYRVLVAEDSITSRMLIKGILESAGLSVKTAADGLEAYSLLRAEPFDLLVSDVEMPRLNGFDLTARVRADPRMAELPVILVTALATQEDRARGADAGASAYIVKGGFEQDDLLAAVERLL